MLAWQKKDGASESVGWDHRDPSGASTRGLASGEYDPMGSNARSLPPPTWPGGTNPEEPLRDLAMPGSGGEAADAQATVDGIVMPYIVVRTIIHSDAVGFDLRVGTDLTNPSQIPIYGQFCGGLEGDSISEMNCDYSVTGYTTDNPVFTPLPDLRKGFEDYLKNPDCAQFAEDILAQIAKDTPQDPSLNLSFMQIFEKIMEQGGFKLVPHLNIQGTVVTGLVDRGNTSINHGNAQVQLFARGSFPSDSPTHQAKVITDNHRQYIFTAFHETFHHAGKYGPSARDEELGRAAFKLTGITDHLPKDDLKGLDRQFAWSHYWDQVLARKCDASFVTKGR